MKSSNHEIMHIVIHKNILIRIITVNNKLRYIHQDCINYANLFFFQSETEIVF